MELKQFKKLKNINEQHRNRNKQFRRRRYLALDEPKF